MKSIYLGRVETHYAYPPSPDSPTGLGSSRPLPLLHRLRTLQGELSALEIELADPSNPLLVKEIEDDNVDPGELIRGLVDVKARLEKIRKGREGRGKLVNAVLHQERDSEAPDDKDQAKDGVDSDKQGVAGTKPQIKSMLDLDRRVGELEKVIGSSSATPDEVGHPLLHQTFM